MTASEPPIWPEPDGTPISCREKLKVLRQNYMELAQVMQDMFEDGVLIGVDEAALRWILIDMISGLESPGQG